MRNGNCDASAVEDFQSKNSLKNYSFEESQRASKLEERSKKMTGDGLLKNGARMRD